MSRTDEFKKQAAEAAVELVESGMVVGLGHGSTVQFALEALAARIENRKLNNIVAVPCSDFTESEARKFKIPLTDLNDHPNIDLTIDGADEVDPQLNLIKGGGGALMREKIVAQVSSRKVIIIDEGKLSAALGTKRSLPVEVSPFGWARQRDFVSQLGAKVELRVAQKGQPILSDQDNYLLDADFGPIADPEGLARALEARSGILEHGLFLGLATDVIVAGPGGLRHLKKS